jgi:DNA modification methylase
MKSNQTITLRLGDCVERMQEMEEGSIGAVICDPPYGLEFMGQEWDKFEPARKTQRWKDKERKLIGDGSGQCGDFSSRMGELPSYIPKRNEKCRTCGHYRFSGNPCKCDEPDWDNRTGEHLQAMQDWHLQWLKEVYRVLQPGGVIKTFSATRTYHRMAVAMREAGFVGLSLEAWGYGSGFPKSHNVSKAIDDHLGVEREVVGQKTWTQGGGSSYQLRMGEAHEVVQDITQPASPEAKQWEGWGTALKPAWEPFVVGRKPE